MTASVVGAIAPKLEQAEIERARRKPIENLDAYDYYLRGYGAFYTAERENIARRCSLFYQAIELDPELRIGRTGWRRCASVSQGHWLDGRREREKPRRSSLRDIAASMRRCGCVAMRGACTRRVR